MITIRQRFIHMTARKLRLVADLVRGKSTQSAIATLSVLPKAAAKPVMHAVKSAQAAAKQKNPNDNFVISAIYIDEGPALKRRILRSRGRASRMEHRMSHITLTLDSLRPESQSNRPKKAVPSEEASHVA